MLLRSKIPAHCISTTSAAKIFTVFVLRQKSLRAAGMEGSVLALPGSVTDSQEIGIFFDKTMSFCRIPRVIALQVLLATLALATTTSSASVSVSNETVPAGAVVQLKFTLSKPALIAAGELAMDLDPTIFGSVTSASAFSANGDAYGLVQIKGLHVDVQFGSLTGGVGQLPGEPMVVLTATVLGTAAAGQTASVTADPTRAIWTDPQQNTYSVTVTPGSVTIGGTLSTASVTPGGGLLPGGTLIEIDGTGFTSATTAEIDGVSIASMQVASPQKILLTLAGPTELNGKRIRVVNPDGSEVDVFPFIPGVPFSEPGQPLDGVVPILPLQKYTAAVFGIGGSFNSRWMAIYNPNAVAVNLLLDTTNPVDYFTGERLLNIPAGGWMFDHSSGYGTGDGNVLVLASAPVQLVQLSESNIMQTVRFGSPGNAVTVSPLQILPGTSALSWVWQPGTPAPAPQSVTLSLPVSQRPTDVTVLAATSSGSNWLSVIPTRTTVPAFETCNSCTSLQVSVNPSSLSPGIYRGTIIIAPVATSFFPNVVPVVIPVALTVTASPLAQTIITGTFFNPNVTSAPVALPPGMFSGPVSVNVVTDSSGNWLSATPNTPSAPTSITIQANPAGFGVGSYSGDVVITGSGNTLVSPVCLNIEGAVRIVIFPPSGCSANFAAQVGVGPLPAQLVQVSTQDCNATGCFDVNPDLSSLAATVATHSGGNWLSASISNGNVLVSANAAGLGTGVYLGTVTLTANAVASAQFPVVLVVEGSAPPALVAGPGLLLFPLQPDNLQAGQVCVSSESVPITFGVQVSTGDGGNWLQTEGGGTTPACFQVSADVTALMPGSHSGNVIISGGQQSVSIPVRVNVPPPSPSGGPPLLGSIASAASEIPASLSPGEIVAIHGQNLGPSTPAGPSVNTQGQFATTVAGVSVTIGGYPAPLLFASQTQINTVVPYEVAGESALTVQVQNGNNSTAKWSVPSAASAPGIFTADNTGLGGGAILNSDSSLNTASNPAAQGSVIQIFATGEGLTNPPGTTGSVATGQHQPVLRVSVTIGNVPAQIIYEGSAPTEIQGLFQVNAVVPSGITPGSAVPIVLAVGQAQSQVGTTIAVQ